MSETIYTRRGRSGPPIDGVTLAGVADKGAELHVYGSEAHAGIYVNVGTRATPRWVRKHGSNPAGGAKLGWGRAK